MSRVRCQPCRLIHLRRLGGGPHLWNACRSGDFPNESSVYDAGFAFFSISNCFRYVRLNPKLIRWSKCFLDSGVWRELCCWSYRDIKKMWDISDLESMKDTSQRPIKKSAFLFLRYGPPVEITATHRRNYSEIETSGCDSVVLCFLLVAKTLDPWRSAISFTSQKKDSKHLIWEDLKLHPYWIYL